MELLFQMQKRKIKPMAMAGLIVKSAASFFCLKWLRGLRMTLCFPS